jgi:hypothetical protein
MTPELRAQVNQLLEGKDPNLLSPEDSKALIEGRFEDVSVEGSKYLTDGFSTGEVILHQAGRAATSTIRGIEKIVDIPGISVDEQKDSADERTSRMMFDNNPVASVAGTGVGVIADPAVLPSAALAPLKGATAFRTGLMRGAVAGTVYGAVEPVYEEYGDSRVLNTLVGAGFGGALGGVVGKLFEKLSPNPKKLAEAESAATEAAIRAEKDAEIELDAAVKTMDDNEMAQGLVSQAVRNNKANPAELRFDPETGTVNSVRIDTSPVTFDALPKGLERLSVNYSGTKVQFKDKIDLALHKIGRYPKSTEAPALRDWLKSKNPKLFPDDAAVDRVAKEAYNGHVKAELPKGVVRNKVLYADQSPIAKRIYDESQQPREVITPYAPMGKTRIDDVFSQDDLDVIEQGLGLKPAGMGWRDTKTNRFVSKLEVNNRLEKLGIEQVPPAQRTQQIMEEPVVSPEMPGMPRARGSVGSRGVRPEDVYAEELGGKLYKDLAKGKITEEEIGRRVAAGEGDLRDRELLRNKTSGKQRWMKYRGINMVNKALKEKGYNDVVDLILDRQKKGQWLEPEERAMFTQTGYPEYISFHRQRIIDEITDMVNTGKSLDSQEYMNKINDLFYYSGIHTFFRNQATYASRMLYAHRRNTAQIKASSPMKSVFPTVRC